LTPRSCVSDDESVHSANSSRVPAVSVVIPLFENCGYIGRALASVFAQTFADFEVIVVDDGSTDGGSDVVRLWTDPRVRLVVQEHRGAGAARNRGLREAQAEWAAFLDADDEWLPEFLESTVTAARDLPAAVAVFTNLLDAASLKPLLANVPLSSHVVADYFRVLLDNNGIGMSSSSTLVRRATLLGLGGFREVGGPWEDGDAWARLAWAGAVGYVPRPLAIYHTETPMSLCKQAPLPVEPPVMRSYREAVAAGAIPPDLELSSRRYANWLLLRHAVELLHSSECSAARRFLRECRSEPGMRALYFGAWVRSHFPHPLLRLVRAMLRSRTARTIQSVLHP
jgi:glycosyltransferase involved in cell wall biosynthesis